MRWFLFLKFFSCGFGSFEPGEYFLSHEEGVVKKKGEGRDKAEVGGCWSEKMRETDSFLSSYGEFWLGY